MDTVIDLFGPELRASFDLRHHAHDRRPPACAAVDLAARARVSRPAGQFHGRLTFSAPRLSSALPQSREHQDDDHPASDEFRQPYLMMGVRLADILAEEVSE
jgi:hypothetical protein